MNVTDMRGYALSLLRIITGALFSLHGFQKVSVHILQVQVLDLSVKL